MSDSDPFAAFESDRTVIKPSAGRGRRPDSASLPGAGLPESCCRCQICPESGGEPRTADFRLPY